MEIMDLIIKIGGIINVILLICGFIFAFVRWLLKQDKQSVDIEELKEHHNEDMKQLQQKQDEDMNEIKTELCEVVYASLACLDGLIQMHCNGNVTIAHERLSKHINKKAHDQK